MDKPSIKENPVNSETPTASKFSKAERLYLRLERFIYWLANQNSNPDIVLLDVDEIVAELLLEFVKGINHYADLPDNELEAVLKRMFDNRIGELKYKYYSTHRKNAVLTVSIQVDDEDDDSDLDEIIPDGAPDVADIYDSAERIASTKERLSPIARQVFNALVYGNSDLRRQLRLSDMRAASQFKTHKIVVLPFHIADALHISEEDVMDALKEIRRTYLEVCDE